MREPSYVALFRTGELHRRAEALVAALNDCSACPRQCRVDREAEPGRCATGADAVIASWGPHHGEEPPLSGRRGSGTIFLANCNLRCVFCQNAEISQAPASWRHDRITPGELASIMLELERGGCHNINWVSPTHQIARLVEALAIAAGRGLSVPIVYNTNAYDAVETLRLLDGIVDIYLPDLKYADPDTARRLSGIDDYPRYARAALTEMYRQVGAEWVVGPDDVLLRGLFVRLLVLPGGAAGVEESLRWLAAELSPEVAVSLMSQYRPAHRVGPAGPHPELAHRLTTQEYRSVLNALEDYNRSANTYVQPFFG